MKIHTEHAKVFASLMEKDSTRFFENGLWVEGHKLVMICNGATTAVVENVHHDDADIDRQLIEAKDFRQSLAIAEATKEPFVSICANPETRNQCPPLADKIEFDEEAHIEFDLEILESIVKAGKAARKAREIGVNRKADKGKGRYGTVRIGFRDKENWSAYMSRVRFSGIGDLEMYVCPILQTK